VIVISFDGVGDQVFESMAKDPVSYPNIATFKEQSVYRGGVKTIFVSNTYPVHTSIATGKLPREHGVISNYVDVKGAHRWAQLNRYIQTETIWDLAAKQGLSTAGILWPVTCGANIRWNMPEVHLHGRENQIVESLRHGSRLFQIKALLRHITNFRGTDPTYLDKFTTAVACDVLQEKRPDLTFLHLIAYDTISHRVGSQAKVLKVARKALDDCLGKVLRAAGDTPVLIFSDHAHLDVSESIDLTQHLGDTLIEQCGGSAFFTRPVEGIESHPWFGRFLTESELWDSGYADRGAVSGIAAPPGYRFGSGHFKSDHGYPVDYENYSVFYAIRSKIPPPEPVFGDGRDITAILRRELGIADDSPL